MVALSQLDISFSFARNSVVNGSRTIQLGPVTGPVAEVVVIEENEYSNDRLLLQLPSHAVYN